MAQNKKKVAADYPAYPGKGVLTQTDDPSYAQAVTDAVSVDGALVVGMPGLSPITFPTDDLTQDQSTGRLSFTSANTPYMIREPREDDGEWLSQYKTLLPLPSVEALIGPGNSGEQVADPEDDIAGPDESLDAFALGDSAYIVGVLYTNNAGRYSRMDGDWVLLSPTDQTFANPDLSVIPIDPDKADQFLAMYDQNYISVADAQNYEDDSDDDYDMSDYAGPSSDSTDDPDIFDDSTDDDE